MRVFLSLNMSEARLNLLFLMMRLQVWLDVDCWLIGNALYFFWVFSLIFFNVGKLAFFFFSLSVFFLFISSLLMWCGVLVFGLDD